MKVGRKNLNNWLQTGDMMGDFTWFLLVFCVGNSSWTKNPKKLLRLFFLTELLERFVKYFHSSSAGSQAPIYLFVFDQRWKKKSWNLTANGRHKGWFHPIFTPFCMQIKYFGRKRQHFYFCKYIQQMAIMNKIKSLIWKDDVLTFRFMPVFGKYMKNSQRTRPLKLVVSGGKKKS